jgi:hypothetical protein
VEDGYDVMLIGDFNLPNIDWSTSMIKSGSPQATIDSAKDLLDLMDSHFMDQYVIEDTRSTNILDLFITNNETIFQDIEVVDTPLSDHRIVKISLTDDPAYQPILTTKEFERNSFRSLNLEKADWEAINQNLSDMDWVSLKASCHDENNFPELFRLTLLQVCIQHTPLKPENIKPYKPSGSRSCRIISRKKRKLQTPD